jgi:hypothetical protein
VDCWIDGEHRLFTGPPGQTRVSSAALSAPAFGQPGQVDVQETHGELDPPLDAGSDQRALRYASYLATLVSANDERRLNEIAANTSDPVTVAFLALLLGEQGRYDDLRRLIVVTGNDHVVSLLNQYLEHEGPDDEITALRRFGLNADGTLAGPKRA